MVADRHTTYGERYIEKLLRAIEKTNRHEMFYVKEPRIPLPDGGSSTPDFVIALKHYGVVILEVKDWVNLREANQREVQVTHKDGSASTYRDPIEQAKDYAFDLTRRFEQRQELMEVYRDRRKIRFPWQVAAALPNIQQAIVDQFIHAGV